MKQTAVEWLVEQLNSKYNNDDFIITHINEIEQAKEMERQQIEDAWNDGNNRYSGIGDSDTYYETLKNK